MVEALALTGVLEKLHTLGFNNIIIESDAKALVDGICLYKISSP
jgi:ribonuclease HI